MDITIENFQTDLLQASMQQPVLLDIWAPWCGPCKQLTPVLERVEAAYEGRFVLAKLNSDEQPEISSQLSQMFGVRSIPFCVLFMGGQPVDGFVGALPEAQIRTFLDKHIPSVEVLAAEADVMAAEAAIAEGQTDDAMGRLQQALATDPNNHTARYDLIKLQVAAGLLAEAETSFAPLLAKTQGPITDPRAVSFAHYLHLVKAQPQNAPVAQLEAAIAANKRDFEARHALAQHHVAAGRFTQAMDELLEIIMRDRSWNNDWARKSYVAILEVMTNPPPKANPSGDKAKGTLELAGTHVVAHSDPVLDQYRRKLSMALF